MKIIRKGAPWTQEVECLKCHSLLLLEENDITLEPSRNAHNCDFGETNWKCPICETQTVIEVPNYLLEMVRTKARWNVGQ